MISHEDYYPGDHFEGGCPFSVDEWIGFQRQLVTADVIMGMLSHKYSLEFLSYYRGLWPGRTLRRRRWHKVAEIRLFLNTQFLTDRNIFYELRRHVMVDLAELYRRQLEDTMIAEYSGEQMNDRELLQRDLETVISRGFF